MSRLNILVPMAGRGSRFAQVGYDLPKPLIDVNGKPMIRLVINNIKPKRPSRFIFLVLQEHEERYSIGDNLRKWSPGCEIVIVDKVTEGAACTALLAKDLIDNEDPLMIANSDQWVDVNIDSYLDALKAPYDGLIMTMWADDPKWSFVRLGGAGEVLEVVEKKVVSNEATVGIYNFRSGSMFVEAAQRMIGKNLRVNNEFYVAPSYNEMIADGKKIAIFNIGGVSKGMYGLGTPSDLQEFISLPISKKAVDFE